MTRRHYEFLSTFQDRLVQPLLDKLDEDQHQRRHPIVHTPDSIELAKLIRSLKIEATSHVSFRVEFTCKGDHVISSVKKDNQCQSHMEHSLWELHLILEMAELKHTPFPARRELTQLRKGVKCVLQIVNPEVYGAFNASWLF